MSITPAQTVGPFYWGTVVPLLLDAGGVTIANLKRLADQGVIRPDEEVVAYVTGNGFKTVEAFEGLVQPSFHVAPDLDEFLLALDC